RRPGFGDAADPVRAADALLSRRDAAFRRPRLIPHAAGVHAVVAEHVADDHREAAEGGDLRVAARAAELNPAVERKAIAKVVNRSEAESGDAWAVELLAREPELLDVRVPLVARRDAHGQRDEMLDEVRPLVSGADAPDAVVDVGVPVPADVGSRQNGD